MALALVAVAGCGGGDDRPTAQPSPPPATTATTPPTAIEPHYDVSGPHFDGAISEISDTRVVLHLLPERRERPEVTFVITATRRKALNLPHLRSDASAGVNTRIFYRRRGRRLIMTGYSHPRGIGGS